MSGVRHLKLLPFGVALWWLHAQAPTSNSYVDSRACAGCHADIASTYAKTGMARSFYRPEAQSRVEGFTRGNPFHHVASDTWYAMLKREGKLYQRRWRIGPGGEEIDVQELGVDYVMGSGNHVRTYLHRTERGALLELPLAWYAENGGTWAMEPGRDRDYVLPPRTVAYECMFCHNAYPKIPANHDEPGSEPLYAGALPEGIDCQRCHGPGGNHVRAAQAGDAAAAVRAAIVNPARLPADRQMEVCLQCHLETTSQPIPHSILRYGRSPFSYRPGEPLGNALLFFDKAQHGKADDFEIAHSAYRLRKSPCFLKSNGKMTCLTCHNPHDIPRGEAAERHYNAACGQCHAETLPTIVQAGKHTAEGNCVGCHMPKRRTDDVVHAVMTDHFIQRRPPSHDPRSPIAERSDVDAHQYRGEVVPYYPAPLPATGENLLYQAVAQVSERSNLAAGLPRLAAEIARQKPQQAEFYVELGQAWLSAGKQRNAMEAFEEAVRRKPNSAMAALSLGDALTEAGDAARAIGVLQAAIRTAPNDPLLWYQLGIAQSKQGGEAAGTAAYRKAAQLDPDLAEAHNLLGAALAAGGDLDGAEKEWQAALRVNPDLPEALGNYGHLLAARRDLPRAAFYFARSVRLKPNDGDVLVNYAVVLAGLNRMEEAQRQIDAAVRVSPGSAEAHNFRGTLLDHGGARGAALEEFLAAVRLRPDFALAHLNAGKVLAFQGDFPAAREHLRSAAAHGDAGIQRQAEAILSQIAR